MKTLAHSDDKAEILRRLLTVRADSRRRWGRMTAHQMICHLADAFRGCMGEKEVRPIAHLFNRTVVKWLALYVPIRWMRGIPTRPEMDQLRGGTPPAEFAADVAALAALLDRITDRDHPCAWQQHPLFGPMREWEWLRWGYLHMDHHLRQFGA